MMSCFAVPRILISTGWFTLSLIFLRKAFAEMADAPSISISFMIARVCTATITFTPSPCCWPKMRTF